MSATPDKPEPPTARALSSTTERFSPGDGSKAESDAMWAEEAERRNAEMDQDEHLGRSAEDVLADLRARRR